MVSNRFLGVNFQSVINPVLSIRKGNKKNKNKKDCCSTLDQIWCYCSQNCAVRKLLIVPRRILTFSPHHPVVTA